MEFLQLGDRVGVLETEHRDAVGDGRELLERRAPNAAGGRLLAGELRKSFLQLEQFAIKLIVLAVADDRRRLFVVAAVVLGNVPSQAFNARACLGFGHAVSIRMRMARTTSQPSNRVIPSAAEGSRRATLKLT